MWTEVPAFAGTTVAVPALRPAQGGRGYGPLYQKTVNHWKPGDTLNKSLNARAFPPSYLRRQEPETLWTEVPAFAGTTVAVPALRPAQGGRGYGPIYQKIVNHWKPGDTLNESLNARAFPPSYLRRQEPETLWTEVPAFAGTTGRDKHPGHRLIQRFLNASDWPPLIKAGT